MFKFLAIAGGVLVSALAVKKYKEAKETERKLKEAEELLRQYEIVASGEQAVWGQTDFQQKYEPGYTPAVTEW